MIFSRLSANWKLAATSNKILLVTNALLAIAVTVLAGLATLNRERVTVVPPSIDKPLTIAWRTATPDYLKSMALYFSGVIGMTGPRTVNYVIDVIDRFAYPSIAEGVKTKIRLQANTYEFRNSTASTWFEADSGNLVYEPETRKVFVAGDLHSVAASRNEIVQPVVYEYIIDVVEGKPYIAHFDSYPGKEAHTLTWLSNRSYRDSDEKRRLQAEMETRKQLGEIMPDLPKKAGGVQ